MLVLIVSDYNSPRLTFRMATQRRNPLTGEWIIVSPHRISRPWGGEKSSSTGQVIALILSAEC